MAFQYPTGKNYKNKNIFFVLALLIFIFLVIRIWTLCFSPDTFHEGELYRGAIAKEILEGRSWPLLLYQNEPHEGGSLIIGIIVSGFFLLFGESLLILKSVSLLLSLLSFLLIIRLMYKYYDLNASLLTGLIIAFSPPIFLIYSVITMGDYYELIAIEMGAILLFFQIFFVKGLSNTLMVKKTLKNKDYLLLGVFGFLNGLGIYFSYAHIILLMTFMMVWFIIDRIFFLRKYFAVHMVSFFIGLLPWIIYNFNYGFRGLLIHQRGISEYFKLSFLWERLKELFVDYIPGALTGYVKWPIFGYLYFLVFICAFIFIVYFNMREIIMRRRGSGYKPGRVFFNVDMFLLFYVCIYVLMYGLSDFRSSPFEDYTHYKYLFPLLPFILMAIGSFLSKIWNFDGFFTKRKLLALLFIIVTIFPSFLFIYSISFNNFNKYLLSYKPYSYELMGCNVIKFESDPFRRLDFIEKIKEEHRAYAYKGFGDTLAEEFMFKSDWYYNEFFKRIDRRFRSYFYTGLCVGLADRFRSDLLTVYHLIINKIDFRFRPYCYEGIGIAKALEKDDVVQLIKQFDKDNLPYFYRGVGIGIMEFTGYNTNRAKKYISNIEEEYKLFCYDGMMQSVYFKEYIPKRLPLNQKELILRQDR